MKKGSPLLIAQIEPPHTTEGGDYYYRTHTPGLAMAHEDGVYVVNLTSQHRNAMEIMRYSDVLILNDVCDADLLPLIKERRLNGKVTVYEIADDLKNIQPWNPVYFFYKDPENRALSLRLANACDALQFSVPELQRLRD